MTSTIGSKVILNMNRIYFSSYVVIVLVLELHRAKTQTYSCTIPSLCRDVGNIIDPRILNSGAVPETPNSFSTPNVGIVSPRTCPAGYVQCTNVVCGTPSVQPSATNGNATQNTFPWQVFLRNNNNLAVRYGYAGGGVLLNQNYVLTAAHKVTNLTSISVLLGVYIISNTANVQTSQVTQVYVHSNYNNRTLKDDVAILQLGTPININTYAMPICTPQSTRNFITTPSTTCVVSGWGQTAFTVDDAPTQPLKQVYLPIVTNSQCTNSFTNILGAANAATYLDFPKEFCAGGQSQLDSCTQDGGSPLVCPDTPGQYTLAGLVLWGKGCGQAGRYGVYLNVPSYANWINCTLQCIQAAQDCSNCPASRIL